MEVSEVQLLIDQWLDKRPLAKAVFTVGVSDLLNFNEDVFTFSARSLRTEGKAGSVYGGFEISKEITDSTQMVQLINSLLAQMLGDAIISVYPPENEGAMVAPS